MADILGMHKRGQHSDVRICFLSAESRGKTCQHWFRCVKLLQQFVSESQLTLDTETYILQRLLYKHAAPFRAQKILSALKQVRRCLHSYSELNIASLLERTVQSWSQCQEEGSFLPSRTCLDDVLFAVYRASVVLSTCAHYCVHVYSCVRQNLHLQHYVPNMILFAATVARIWIAVQSSWSRFLHSELLTISKSTANFLTSRCISLALLRDMVSFYNSITLAKQEFPVEENQKIDDWNLPQCISNLLVEYQKITENSTQKGGLWGFWQKFQSTKSPPSSDVPEVKQDSVDPLRPDRTATVSVVEDVGEALLRTESKVQTASPPGKKSACTSKRNRQKTGTKNVLTGKDNAKLSIDSSVSDRNQIHTVISHCKSSESANYEVTKLKDSKEKSLRLPTSLGNYAKCVYTDENASRKFLRYMAKTPCKVKVQGHKNQIQFAAKVCSKFVKEVSLQKALLDECEQEVFIKNLKKATMRLKKRLVKAILTAEHQTNSHSKLENYETVNEMSRIEDVVISNTQVELADEVKHCDKSLKSKMSKVKTKRKEKAKLLRDTGQMRQISGVNDCKVKKMYVSKKNDGKNKKAKLKTKKQRLKQGTNLHEEKSKDKKTQKKLFKQKSKSGQNFRRKM